MPHAILTGDPQHLADIRAYLEAHGLTVTLSEPGAGVGASLGQCDVLVCSGHRSLPPAGDEQRAPVLYVGPDAPPPGAHAGWDPDRGDGPLAEALEACVLEAARRRGRLPADLVPDACGDFLGHELRTPLSAVRTALEALADDLVAAPANAGDAADGSRRLVDLALRNVDRLCRTVEWSQRLRTLADAPQRCSRRVVTLSELAACLETGATVVTKGTEAADAVLETDPVAVAAVVAQLMDVLAYVGPPSGPPQLECHGDLVTVRIAVREDGDGTAPTARHGLTTTDDDGPARELRRLCAAMVPAAVLESLGATLRPAQDGTPALELLLPLPVAVPAS